MKWRKNEERYPLAKDDAERLEVVKMMHELLAEARTVKQILPRLKERFPNQKLSRATVYRMHDECKQIYGNRKIDAEYYRGLLVDWQLEALQFAKKKQDLKEWNNAIKNLIKIIGVDRDIQDLPDFEKYMNQVFVMNVTVNNEKMPIDLNNADKIDPTVKDALLNAEDVEFEEFIDK